MAYKILLSNLGYARGINGCLTHHLFYGHRYFYCPPAVQQKSLEQFRTLIEREDPDICCLIEIDKGSSDVGEFNQLEYLLNSTYRFFDIENKYGEFSWLRKFHLTRGKSNAFLSKHPFPHEHLHLQNGIKTLIYKIQLEPHLTLFFAHFSLKKHVRHKQLQEVRELIEQTEGDVIFMGDFNILTGLGELDVLLFKSDLVLLNEDQTFTFHFHNRKLVLDLCLCSKRLATRAHLKVIPQSFSDHAALLLTL